MRHTLGFAFFILGCSGGTSPSLAVNDAASDTAPPIAATVCENRANVICRSIGKCDGFTYLARWYRNEAECVAGEKLVCERDLDLPGVVDAVAQVEACTKHLAMRPACAPAATPLFCSPSRARGTLAEGSGCAYDEQCESGFCAATGAGFDGELLKYPSCGTCARRPLVGDPCSALESGCDVLSTTMRGDSLVCDPAAGKCVVRKPLGEACTFADACDSGLTCNAGRCVTAASGTIKLLATGAECGAADTICSGGEWCKRSSTAPVVCTPPLALGAACSGWNTCGHVNHCADVPGEGRRCTEARRCGG